ncbi:hypothetical protein CCACVL1_02229, partial [Corchorus capsularis]
MDSGYLKPHNHKNFAIFQAPAAFGIK